MEYHLIGTLPNNTQCCLLFLFCDTFDHSGEGLFKLFKERWTYLVMRQGELCLRVSQLFHIRAVTEDTVGTNLGPYYGFCAIFSCY